MHARQSRWAVLVGTVLILLGKGQIARAQGFIIDRRPTMPIARAYEIREVAIDARVRDQVAEVQVSQTFHNPGSVQIESESFQIPESGWIVRPPVVGTRFALIGGSSTWKRHAPSLEIERHLVEFRVTADVAFALPKDRQVERASNAGLEAAVYVSKRQRPV